MKRAVVFVAILALGSAGCATSGDPRRSAGAATGGAVAGDAAARNFLAERRGRISSVRAGLEIEWSSLEGPEPVSCRATLSFAAPTGVRLRGTSSAFFTIFDLVAGSDSIFIDVPREELLVAGLREDPAWEDFVLTPELLVTALLAAPSNETAPAWSWTQEGDRIVARRENDRLEFDSITGNPRRWVRPGDGTWIEWREWDEVDGIPWPLALQIERPSLGEGVEIRFGRVQIDGPVRKESFEERPGSSRRVLGPSKGLEHWRAAIQEGGAVIESR